MRVLLTIVFLFCVGFLTAQNVEDPTNKDEYFSLTAPLTVDLSVGDEEEDEFVEFQTKKRKKKEFYGVKTKKRFTKDGDIYEQFYVLKEIQMPDPYVRDVYWLDAKTLKIKVGRDIDPRFGSILHGPYRKVKGDQVLEEGIFYFGTKHGRRMTYDKNNILQDKEKYFRGWPRESQVSYYDRQRSKMKEIIPVEYGEKEGNYYFFHPNGKIAVRGEFKFDQPVGEWTEYYPSGYRKKIVRFTKDPFDETTRPQTIREWDPRGKVVFDRRKVQ
jgi:hypothetical protein